jgi:tetratricopeptide (TPR) repeat protein
MNELSQITILTNSLMKSAALGDRQQTANSLLDLLWHVAELRSDMPNFLIWLGNDSGPITGQSYSERIGKAVLADDQQQMTQMLESLVSGSVLPLLPKDDLTEIELKLVGLMQSASAASPLSVLAQICDMMGKIAAAKQKTGRLTIHLEGGDAENDYFESLHVGLHTSISFRRTLRVPEDGKEYPLPADLGELPIYRIEDFAENVPSHWLEEGGFFIPLYQREALFLEFKGVKWRPSIAKVAVGRINAITGKPYEEEIHAHEQDYVVIPGQRWLDGINKGKNIVSQFVAMPLGQGYTIEEQLTDEAKHGGFQIVAFDPKEDRFPSEDPEVTKRRKRDAAKRRIQAKQDIFISRLDLESQTLATLFLECDTNKATKLGISTEAQMSKLRMIRDALVQALGDDGQVLLSERWSDAQIRSFIEWQQLIDETEMTDLDTPSHVPSRRREGFVQAANCPRLSLPSSAVKLEMGIAAGGSIKQQIQRDTFGADAWDSSAKRMVIIRIVNSAAFQKITGKPPPETPVTLETYQAKRMPWFDSYDEAVESVTPARKFSFLKTVAAIARLRGKDISDDHASIEVDSDLVERIQTPTHEERVKTFLERAEVSIRAKRFTTAMREATLALNLVQGQSFLRRSTHDDNAAFRRSALNLRAQCYIQLQRFREAEEDATEALDIPPQDDCLAFVTRAEAYLGLLEYDLAVQDATNAIDIYPEYHEAYALRAEAHMHNDHDDDALQDSERALAENPRNSRALIVRGEIRRMYGSLGDAVSDLTRAMLITGPDPVALCARAKAFVQLGDNDQARADLHSALLIDPNFAPAIEHLQFMP